MKAPLLMGLDLTTSPKRPSAYALLRQPGEVVGLGALATDEDILGLVKEQGVTLAGIDSPMALPLGLCCLEESCACQQASPFKGRSAERELARLGIGSYFTTKRSIIKAMVYRGIGLKAHLEALGVQALEVYPYASKVRLFGKPIPKKTTPEGLAFLKERLMGLMPSLAPHLEGLNHDLCDALMAAYTAVLYLQGATEALGAPGRRR
jgi:predicted nuclease with RNAse H fold